MKSLSVKSPFIQPRDIALTGGLSLGYLVLSYFLIGFKSEQLFLIALFNTLYYINGATRKLIIGFSVFIIYWIIFDYMKAFPNYHYNSVHIESLYQFDKSLFAINDHGKLVTPNEFFMQHSAKWMDILAGLFYLCWVPVPLAFAAWLFYKNRPLFVEFSLVFLFVNLVGFLFYYIYPAAPPWYVQQYGFDFLPGTPGNTAGLARFDQAFGIQLFHGMYAKSSNVFAAMPSLHSAYPVVTLYYAVKSGKKPAMAAFTLVMMGIWIAAVYTSHHYVSDVIAGICCAVVSIFIFRRYIKPTQTFLSYLTALS